MLAPAASFTGFVLGIHIIAVVVSFGLLFVYPLLGVIGARLDPRAVPSWHRLQSAVHRRVSSPGLGVIILAGAFVASEEHQWSKFYVGWGIAAAVAIGAIGGAYLMKREQRMIELAEREVAAGAGVLTPATGEPVVVPWSADYVAVRRQVDLGRLLQVAIATVTIFFMALHLGA
jgi:hypothetical protein